MTIGERVNRAARLMRRLADARLGRFGISSGYLPVITALMDGDELTQKALVAHAGIEQPTMVNTLARMERHGILQRRPDPIDKRSARFLLADPIRERIPEIRAAIDALGAEAVSALTPDERTTLDHALAIMARSIEAALREPSDAKPIESGEVG